MTTRDPYRQPAPPPPPPRDLRAELAFADAYVESMLRKERRRKKARDVLTVGFWIAVVLAIILWGLVTAVNADDCHKRGGVYLPNHGECVKGIEGP
jgi:hypothetical protein